MSIVLGNTTPGGIPYHLREGHPTFEYQPNSIAAVEEYVLDWTNSLALAIEYFNYNYTGVIFPYPMEMPGFPGLYCDKISVRPLLADLPGDHNETLPNGQPWKNYAVATINYKSLEPRSTEGFTRTTSIGGEFVMLPRHLAKWATAYPGTTDRFEVNPDDPTPGVFCPTFDHTLRYDRLSSVPWNAMKSLIGAVNNATILGSPAETLLFAGADVRSKGGITGETFQVDLKVIERPTNWNRFFRPSIQSFDYMTWNGNRAYRQDDLTPLFV